MANIHSLAAIIQVYRRRNEPKLEAHLESYRKLAPDQAMLHAAMAERFDEAKGKWNRHDHQRRLKRVSLEDAYRSLQMASVLHCESFHDLFLIVERAIGQIPGIGELMVYDTSLRIGASAGLQPDRVYLHSGTRKGAKRLGLPTESKWLFPTQLPQELQTLSPCQVEDLLCIYKDRLDSDRSRSEALQA